MEDKFVEMNLISENKVLCMYFKVPRILKESKVTEEDDHHSLSKNSSIVLMSVITWYDKLETMSYRDIRISCLFYLRNTN